jgi:hypothetical protein
LNSCQLFSRNVLPFSTASRGFEIVMGTV